MKSNIFYLYNNIRSKITYSNNEYTSLAHNKTWNKSEILEEIGLYPERFSPNVFENIISATYFAKYSLYRWSV